MKNKLKCIMLVDDDKNDNYFHEREIKKTNPEAIVLIKNTGLEALEYIQSKENINMLPDLIFLDINMPGMNGWAFLENYEMLDKEIQNSIIIIMLTSSDNDEDIQRSKSSNFVYEFISKPLTEEKMKDINKKYFNGQ